MSITAQMVKELREKTGVGMMDCKKALVEADGDLEKAIEILRKKGIARAEKKSGRTTNEGAIFSYIHPGNKLGVLVEINCETDFVARTQDFLEFGKNIAMQIAASAPIAVGRKNLDKSLIEKEKEIYMEQMRASGKPEHVIEKIVQGKLEKYFSEVCLLEQPYVKEPKKTVEEYIKETIGKLGENITIARFSRFQLGENQS